MNVEKEPIHIGPPFAMWINSHGNEDHPSFYQSTDDLLTWNLDTCDAVHSCRSHILSTFLRLKMLLGNGRDSINYIIRVGNMDRRYRRSNSDIATNGGKNSCWLGMGQRRGADIK